MLIRGQYIKMFLMTSIYFLSTPEYLIGSPKKETNLKIQSMGEKKKHDSQSGYEKFIVKD